LLTTVFPASPARVASSPSRNDAIVSPSDRAKCIQKRGEESPMNRCFSKAVLPQVCLSSLQVHLLQLRALRMQATVLASASSHEANPPAEPSG
jgi:hypothetical protein